MKLRLRACSPLQFHLRLTGDFPVSQGEYNLFPAFLREDWTSMLLVKAGNDMKHSQLHFLLALLNVIFTFKGCLRNEYSFPALLPLVEVLVLMLNVLSFLGEKLLC